MNMNNDLSTLIKRLSILASVPVKPAGKDDDDEVEDDDDDEDEDDEEVESGDDNKENERRASETRVTDQTRPGQSSETRPHLSKQSSFPKLSSSGLSGSSLNAFDSSKNEKNSSRNFYQTREAKTSGSNLIHIHETDERAGDDLEDEFDVSAFNAADESHSTIQNSTAMPFSEQLTIKTEFLGNYTNQKSPRTQAIELGKQLELEKAENIKLKEALNLLKCKLEPKIKELTKQNTELKDELIYTKRLLKELRETNDINQLEASRTEMRTLNDRLASAQATNAQLTSQIERLSKFEETVKLMSLVDVNKKTYQLLNRIGEGGFSEVFQCISLKDRKNYALKRVDLTRLDTENIDSIMNEIELLKKLQTTSKVVQLIDYEHVQHKKQMNILMELGSMDLNGFVKKEIQKHGSVQEPARVYYWKKMLEAVDAIHREGVIHSDIKPGNFLIVGCDVKLIDFNISNTVSDRTSVTMGFDCGTINYMAPESLMADSQSKMKVTKKTDVWALAVILYLMTYGRLPLQHIKNQYALMHAICDAEKKEFKFAPLKSEALLDVLKRCFRHDQGERYSVEELLKHRYITGHSE